MTIGPAGSVLGGSVSNFSARVFQLASEAAKLARLLSAQRDVLGEVVRHLQAAQLSVTHCGHAAFRTADVGFSGADGFQVEDALVRLVEGGVEIEPEQKTRWFALFTHVPPGHDAILASEFTTGVASTATAFIRCRLAGGGHADGPRVPLGGGQVLADCYVHHPDVGDAADYSSQLFVTIDNFSGATIRQFAVVTTPTSL